MVDSTNNARDDKLRAIHHYVPQSYLRRFAIDSKPNQVYAYEIGKSPYPTNIKNIASQRDFYTIKSDKDNSESAELESAMADIDDKGAELLKVLDSLSDGEVKLSESQQGDLYAYIAFLHTRNLQERKQWASSYEQSSLLMMQVKASNKDAYHADAQVATKGKYDFEQVESSRQAVLNGKTKLEFDPMDPYFLGATLAISKELYFILMKMKRPVLVSAGDTSRVFITSDNPVTHYAQEKTRSPYAGLGYINAIFQLPISPTRCLLLLNEDMKVSTYKCDSEAVNHMNFYTFYYADRWVFSNIKAKTFTEMFEKHKATQPMMRIDSPFNRTKTKDK